jgi:putative FmdB family regulatory protein
MPTYEYECKSCGYNFDVFQSMSEDPKKVCPACGKEVRRIINGGTAIIFKGSGFYVTDSKKASSAAALPKPALKDGKSASPGEPAAKAAKETAKETQKEGVAAK